MTSISFTGIKEDEFIKHIMKDQLNSEIEKLNKMISIDSIKIAINHHRESGTRTKFSIKLIAETKLGFFHSDHSDWEMTKTFKKSLEKLEREIINKKRKTSKRGL